MYSDIILEKDALYILWYHAFLIYVDQKKFKHLKSPSPLDFFSKFLYFPPKRCTYFSNYPLKKLAGPQLLVS